MARCELYDSMSMLCRGGKTVGRTHAYDTQSSAEKADSIEDAAHGEIRGCDERLIFLFNRIGWMITKLLIPN